MYLNFCNISKLQLFVKHENIYFNETRRIYYSKLLNNIDVSLETVKDLTSSSHGNKLAVSPASLGYQIQISCAHINKVKLMPSCQHRMIFDCSTSGRQNIGTLHFDDNVCKGLHLICNEMLRVMHTSKSHEKLGNTVRYNISCKWIKENAV